MFVFDQLKSLGKKFFNWLWNDFLGIVREMRLSYLPPLLIYFAAGVSGFTGIVESFFVKENLGVSAAFLAGLAFWAGLPWVFKMPLGHLVDIFWRHKSVFVYLGAALMMAALLIMVGLTGEASWITSFLSPEKWYVLAAILSPIGFVMQDVVADAMTVEAVPLFTPDGKKFNKDQLQRMHVNMQTLGRVSVILGSAIVAGAGGWLATILPYKTIYEIALVIPLISVIGVILGSISIRRRKKVLLNHGFSPAETAKMTNTDVQTTPPNWKILAGSVIFVLAAILLGASKTAYNEEIVFVASLALVAYLIFQLVKNIGQNKRREIVGIAIIIFVFRSMPTFGAGSSWWQIDMLGFNESFLGTLRQISSFLAIFGMLALRGWMARKPLPYLVVFLSIAGVLLTLPFIAMFYGLHIWTMQHFGFGAKTIALVDTMAESPLGQVAMVPMLAWIAKEAPAHQKATFFAVFAAFTNLALSASSLLTKYINKIFVIERGQYEQLGHLMITVSVIGLILPILTVLIFRPRDLKKK